MHLDFRLLLPMILGPGKELQNEPLHDVAGPKPPDPYGPMTLSQWPKAKAVRILRLRASYIKWGLAEYPSSPSL